MNPGKLEKKKAARVSKLKAARKKSQAQRRKFQRTKKKGYLKAATRNSKAAKRHAAAVRKLDQLIELADQYASPHFRYSEFDCHDGTKVPQQSYEALRHLCQNYLEPLRAKFGSVGVTSGFRPQGYNASIGGASSSVHIYDFADGRNFRMVAADVYCSRGSVSEWGDYLRSLNPGGLGIYPGSGFCHVDNRQLAGWTKSEWWG